MIDLTNWAKRFIATPSESRLGNARIAEQALSLLAELGLEGRVETAEVHGVTHHAVIAEFGPTAPDGLLLVTHLDTVPPGDACAWTETGGDPCRPTRVGDKLYGLGSADAKVDFVCKAAALAAVNPERLRRPVRLIGTFAEEIGLLGARWLIDRGYARGMRYALVGEPSELIAIHAHKGYAVFRARIPCERLAPPAGTGIVTRRFDGLSAHSSTPHLGRNAIDLALRWLGGPDVVGLVDADGGGAVNKVPESCDVRALVAGGEPLEGKVVLDPGPLAAFHNAWQALLQELEQTRDNAFDPNHSVGNIGRIEVRETDVELRFDLRPIPGARAEEIVRPLAQLADLESVRANPPLSTPRDSHLLHTIASVQQELGWGERIGTKATCTEAGLLSTADLEAVVFGAGVSVGNVHRPNEHTLIPQLAQARDLYRGVLERL